MLDRRLVRKLGDVAPTSTNLVSDSGTRSGLDPKISAADPGDSRWLDEYLLGFAAEWDVTASSVVPLEVGDPSRAAAAQSEPGIVDTRSLVQRQAARRALSHYSVMLELRPDSYWGNYRAAVASFALDEFGKAAGHLERCLKRRPNNPLLHGVLAGCLKELGDFRALDEANLAIQNAPEKAEWYRSRAFIRSVSRQTTGLADDIQNFELLSNLVPRSFWGQTSLAADGENSIRSSPHRVLDFRVGLANENRFAERGTLGRVGWNHGEVDQDELAARAFFASTLREANEPDLAEVEVGKILALDPDNIEARLMRARQSIEGDRFDEAFPDLEAVLSHPGLLEYLRNESIFLDRTHSPTKSLIIYLHDVSRHYCLRGKFDQGRTIAQGTRRRNSSQPPLPRIPLQLRKSHCHGCPDRPRFHCRCRQPTLPDVCRTTAISAELRTGLNVQSGQTTDQCASQKEARSD